ncbi:MAG: hypothetical protein J5546_03495 [Lachnospiraceae bacterium]|nr:hypothetical protein [Lachnospiraceae bacterium]
MRVLRPKKAFHVTAFLLYMSIRSVVSIPFDGGTAIVFAVVSLVGACLMLLTIGGFKAEIEPPFEDSPKYKECFLGTAYDMEKILQREKDNKERYYKEQKESGFIALEGVGIMLVGILINMASTWVDNRVDALSAIPILPIGHLAGYYVEYFGAAWIFKAYLNSGLSFAMEISKKFMQHTTSVKIEECSKMIAVIQNKLREKEEKAKKSQLIY